MSLLPSPLGDEPQHFELALRQVDVREPDRRGARRQAGSAVGHRPQRRGDGFRVDRLGKVARHAGLAAGGDGRAIVIGRQHDDSQPGVGGAKLDRGVRSPRIRKAQVEDHHVGMLQPAGLVDCVSQGACRVRRGAGELLEHNLVDEIDVLFFRRVVPVA